MTFDASPQDCEAPSEIFTILNPNHSEVRTLSLLLGFSGKIGASLGAFFKKIDTVVDN
jgi:hypothetical protein